MILSIFASSVVLVFGALFHTIGQILNDIIVIIAGFHVEVSLHHPRDLDIVSNSSAGRSINHCL